MALTDAQKSEIRRAMGAPDVSRQYDLRLESSMDALTTEGEARVVEMLVDLALVRTQITDFRACRLQVKRVVGEVELANLDELWGLYREGNRLAWEIGVSLYFTPRRKPFGVSNASWAFGGSGNIARRG